MLPRIPTVDGDNVDIRDLKPKMVEVQTNTAPQEASEISWSSAFEPEEEVEEEDIDEVNWVAVAAIGAVVVFFGLGMVGTSFGFGVGMIFLGIMMIGAALAAKKGEANAEDESFRAAQFEKMEEQLEWEETARARQREREKEVQEIIKAVKTTIRVRCRYCGTLNEEKANKCEACGASL
jgi:hypothetical protein